MLKLIRQTIIVFATLTLITGVAYPLLITTVAQVVFPYQSNGSLIERDGRQVGSALIGQQFDAPEYFCGRPSATSPAYNASASSGSNLGPTNPAQLDAVRLRVEKLRKTHPQRSEPVPIDLVTASASGLDPQITPAAAEFQIDRVAQARNMEVNVVRGLVAEHTSGRQLGILGEPRVNVLQLNLALDAQIK
jgi:K+-transporting ATPase ATPase C chain